MSPRTLSDDPELEFFMPTRCERHGQIEIGIIEHDGREFAALGATVCGHAVTAYTTESHGHLTLTTWCGHTMLDCRSTVVETYWTGAFVALFRLTNSRYILGYSLGDGMLFRGELLIDVSEDEAVRQAKNLAHYWAERDAEDEEVFAAEQSDD